MQVFPPLSRSDTFFKSSLYHTLNCWPVETLMGKVRLLNVSSVELDHIPGSLYVFTSETCGKTILLLALVRNVASLFVTLHPQLLKRSSPAPHDTLPLKCTSLKEEMSPLCGIENVPYESSRAPKHTSLVVTFNHEGTKTKEIYLQF